MTSWDYLTLAGQSLRTNLMRSVLTALGIIIGVAAVIMMMAVGAGAESRISAVIQSLGSNLIYVRPGSASTRGAALGAGSQPTLTEADAAAIEREVPSVAVAAASVRGSGQVVNGNLNWSTLFQGVTPGFFAATDWSLARGRWLDEGDVRRHLKVALLGATVAGQIFPGEDPVGQRIRVARVPFEVVGVLARKGPTPFGTDQDDVLFLPISTAKSRVLGPGARRGDLVDRISIKVRSADLVATAERDVRALLRQRHRIPFDQPDDFDVRNLAQILNARADSTRVMTLLLATVASVSLLVGGIGIMNIMLVSVTERTREIGLRMASGASAAEILTQFVVEALTISLIGGVIGVAAGLGGAWSIARFADWPVLMQPESVLLAAGFAAGTGVFFGWYPARKASRLDPIEALRTE